MSTTPQRPPQVVSACLFLGAGCAILLVNLVQLLVTWNSIEVRGALDDAFDAVGTTATEGRVEALRIGVQVFVPVLVAGMVCGFYAVRGHRGARVVLTAVSGLTVLGFLATGSVLALLPVAVVGYSVAQLWSKPVNRWFAGAAPDVAVPVSQADPFADRSAAPVENPPIQHPPTQPPPFGGAPPLAGSGTPREIRTIDLVVTLGGAVTALGAAAYLAIYLLAYDGLVRFQLESPGRSMIDASDDELVAGLRGVAVIAGVALVASAAALVATRLLVRRQRLGHLLLTIVAGVTVPIGIFTILGIPWAGVAIWVLVLLRRPATRAWVVPADR